MSTKPTAETLNKIAQHTPGPWIAEPNGGDDPDSTKRFICRVESGPWTTVAEAYNLDTRKETEANARLIAAAPELLEALKQIVAEGECYCADHVAVTGECGHCSARRAIDLAEGRQ